MNTALRHFFSLTEQAIRDVQDRHPLKQEQLDALAVACEQVDGERMREKCRILCAMIREVSLGVPPDSLPSVIDAFIELRHSASNE